MSQPQILVLTGFEFCESNPYPAEEEQKWC